MEQPKKRRFATLNIICDVCHKPSQVEVKIWDPRDYKGEILKAMWCSKCEAPQVIKYKFVDDIPEVTIHLEPNRVFFQEIAETKILTVRPKAEKKIYKETIDLDID